MARVDVVLVFLETNRAADDNFVFVNLRSKSDAGKMALIQGQRTGKRWSELSNTIST
jgi:hypothetical protein